MSTNWPAKLLVAVLLLGAVGGLGYYWWLQQQAVPPAAEIAPIPITVPALPASPPEPAPPVIRHPIDTAASEPGQAADATPDMDRQMADGLATLLGRADFLAFVLPTRFIPQVVATVDALGRDIAPPRLWPVPPTPGRFTVEGPEEAAHIAAHNARRYQPFVRMATHVDPVRAAALYRRFYPHFQAAYEELGYPGRYFNDRLVEVIDLLLATPELADPVPVALTRVKGPIAAPRPWTRYEFIDPALEALPAGQKIMLRVGPAHARALKAQLRALRAEITRR